MSWERSGENLDLGGEERWRKWEIRRRGRMINITSDKIYYVNLNTDERVSKQVLARSGPLLLPRLCLFPQLTQDRLECGDQVVSFNGSLPKTQVERV